MGKYMRKGKDIGNVALMEVSQGPLGLRTRARAQAPYLELRSRKLEKNWCLPKLEPSQIQSSEASHGGSWQNFECRKGPSHSHFAPVDSPSTSSFENDTGAAAQEDPNFTIAPLSRSNSFSLSQGRARGILTRNQRIQQKTMLVNSDQSHIDCVLPLVETANLGDSSRSMENLCCFFPQAEASFGENPMDHEELPATDRPIREGTPTSYAREIEAPGSATRPSCGGCGQGRTASIQSAYVFVDADIDDFFKGAEQQEQRRFMERYNFDPVNDRPMPGRYEWVSM